MEKENMIKAIYEKIADKKTSYTTTSFETSYKKVNIWDVIDYSQKKADRSLQPIAELNHLSFVEELLRVWKLKREPIEEQTLECIEYIYYLIK